MALTAQHTSGSFKKYGGVRETSQIIYGRNSPGFYGVILTENSEEILLGPFDSRKQASRETLGEIRAVAKWCKGYALMNT